MEAFAIYSDREVTVRYFNGAGYVVRHEMYPHTQFKPGSVTRQGNAMLVGIRQGTGTDGGFTYRRYRRPDTAPAWVGTCPRCSKRNATAEHIAWCDWQAS